MDVPNFNLPPGCCNTDPYIHILALLLYERPVINNLIFLLFLWAEVLSDCGGISKFHVQPMQLVFIFSLLFLFTVLVRIDLITVMGLSVV